MGNPRGNIQLDFACDQNWNDMPFIENGKYCEVCEQCVYDFTKKSLSEINETRLNGPICGKFTVEQLDNDIITEIKPPKVLKVLTLFSFFLFASKSGKAQSIDTTRTELAQGLKQTSNNIIAKNDCKELLIGSDSINGKYEGKIYNEGKNTLRIFLIKKFPFIKIKRTKKFRTIGRLY